MQISMEEVDRILQSRLKAGQSGQELHDVDAAIAGLAEADSPDVFTRSEEVQRVKELIAEMPDVREDRVAEIQARLANGSYKVSSAEVADLMVRRALADTVEG